MPKTFQTPFWRTVLPDRWQARRYCGDKDGEFVTIWHPEGVGKLTILIPIETPARTHPGTTYSGSLTGYVYDGYPGIARRSWWLLCGEKWLVVRFCSTPDPDEWETAAVDSIVQSIAENVQP
jgi:hypothetical protein